MWTDMPKISEVFAYLACPWAGGFCYSIAPIRHPRLQPYEGVLRWHSMKLYGIKNCDTVKRARAWLEQHGLAYEFHDFRQDGLDETMIRRWQATVSIDTLLNRRGTTWRNLDTSLRDNLAAEDIPALLVSHPTLVKRPVLERDDDVMVGFSDKGYSSFFAI